MTSCIDVPRIAVLAFHKIGPPPHGAYPTWNYIPESTFVTILDYLEGHGWVVVDLETFLQGLTEPTALPQRAVLLTFDDGYCSMVTVTLPLLQRFGYPAVLFVPTAFVGGYNSFDEGIEPRESICSWDELRALELAGVAVQSHSVHHRPFSELVDEDLEFELRESKATLENGLGRPVETFAYPYGDSGRAPERSAQLAEDAGYRAALLYHGGVTGVPFENHYAIPRLALGPDSKLAELLSEDE